MKINTNLQQMNSHTHSITLLGHVQVTVNNSQNVEFKTEIPKPG